MSIAGKYFDKIVIDEDLYRIEQASKRLVQVDNERNILEYKNMIQGPHHYNFVYHKKENAIVEASKIDYPNPGDYVQVSIPTIVLYLKQRCNLGEYDQINAQSIARKQNFQMLGLAYAEQEMGIKPRLYVGDQTYCFRFKDLSMGRAVSEPELFLQELKVVQTAQGNFFEAFFHIKEKKLENINPGWQADYPEHYIARIPEVKVIDPVDAARADGKMPYAYLNDYPIRTDHIKLYVNRYATGELLLFPHTRDLSNPQRGMIQGPFIAPTGQEHRIWKNAGALSTREIEQIDDKTTRGKGNKL